MSSLDEKRVHVSDTDPETVIVASETGVATVSIAGGRVGGVSLRYRKPAATVATRSDRALVGTDGGVLELADEEIHDLDGPTPVNAVAIDGSGRVLAGSGGELVRRDADGTWHSLGSVGDIRAIDVPLLASRDGVFQLLDDELRYSGLDDVFDVTSVAPHAATAEGLYALANGWVDVLDGSISVVTTDPETTNHGSLGRAYAVGEEGAYEHTESGWQRRAFPTDERVVDVAFGERAYAVTEDGTFLVDDGDEWRTHPLGLRGVRALAVVSP